MSDNQAAASAYDKPIPVPSPESRPFWEALRAHKLAMPKCGQCGHRWFPPTLLCPSCRSAEVTWQPVSGRGKVFSFVNFHRTYHRGFADERPYCVAVIALDEGPRMISTMVGIAPSDVSCDLAVEVVFEDITETATLAKFRPVG